MDKLKLGNKMKEIKINKPDKIWVLCACPECESEFIAKLEQTDDVTRTILNVPTANPHNLFGLKPLPEELTCPYCGIKNDIYAEHFPKVEL